MLTDDKPIVLGRISGLYGVKGWNRIHSYTDPRDAILDYPGWLVEFDGQWQPMAFVEGKRHGKSVIARLAGVEDRDAAARLVNANIGVLRKSLPQTGEGEYYWSDLEGLSVIHLDGKVLGNVAYLLETGANDVLVVEDGEHEILIPFVNGEIVKAVDLAKGEIRVDWEWG